MTSPHRLLTFGAAVSAAVCALLLAPAADASAHPLGNFTVNRYDGLIAAPGTLRVDHVEDLAEIPATQAAPAVKRLGLTAWARARCAAAADDAHVTVDGRESALTVRSSTARVRPGQAGLDTLRVRCALTAPLPSDATVDVRFHGAGASTGPGWREITARGDRMTLTASDVPKTSVSRELTSYPTELLASPADAASASLRIRPGGPALAEPRQNAPAAAVLPRGADRWTRALESLVARHDLTLGFAALALLIAVALGAAHALAPGHGKTLMAATAAARGGRARLKDVLPLAASVTVTHTLGVVALGLLVTAGSAAAPSVITWLGTASGALVIAAGLTLARRAWRNGHAHHGHGHPHPHPHPHAPAPIHPHETGPHTARTPERALVLASAHAPAPTATAPTAQATSSSPHGGHIPHSHEHHHPHDHTSAHVHTHGGVTHSHPIAPTLRGTILLGFAGGLVPSPSAVVVLVGAAALGKAWFGLLLVVGYGVGLALTLTAAGIAVVKVGTGMNRVLDRRPGWTARPTALLVRRSVPLLSASLVVAVGVGLVLKGVATAFS
ncbi:nickel transporter [Streptomyces sp. NPDC087212]|uniref:nickel transporter n=1 Tax=Streptomyces sp. NPDC087212 TaxID=3365766 RepID=UPI003809BE8C